MCYDSDARPPAFGAPVTGTTTSASHLSTSGGPVFIARPDVVSGPGW